MYIILKVIIKFKLLFIVTGLKSKLKENNARLVAVSQEKAKLEAKNKLNMAADAAGQEQAKIAFNNKQITLKQLRDKLQDMEKQVCVCACMLRGQVTFI